MAYDAAVTDGHGNADKAKIRLSNGGDSRRHLAYRIVETGAANTDEFSLDVPEFFEIVFFQATLISGTGTTIKPKFGRDGSWVTSTQTDGGEWSGAAAVSVKDQTATRLWCPGGKLYIKNYPDAGSDNVIHTDIGLLEGWSR